MKILAVDTATPWQSVAILDDQRVVARRDQDAGRSHSKLLLPAIDELFAESGLSLKQLEGLVVSIGPGSFTGLRVGLATMLGFRTITGLPLAVVPTLEGLAWNLRGASTPLCPVLSSRRDEVYWAVFRWVTDNLIERVIPEQVGPPSTLGGMLAGPTVMMGQGWEVQEAAIRNSLARSVKLTAAPAHAMKPSAVSVGLAGMARLRSGDVAGLGISPLYIQQSEAELKYEQSGGVSPVARRQERVAKKLGARMARIRVGESERRIRTRGNKT
ncbi:MAG TPA: tRNA (adenosine(37)-N6)-threonylcarbamoyltransferase complex dimerization subunit type 1 TsaB [Nitrospiraceae bacterium]|nr:tRNA (adenosine(37)-N6)-threonylcarbamoyltransferase complex dimerization subunit type 1 TsaB [Nitrospiraceae bacterium]